jgi:hypothetical protein
VILTDADQLRQTLNQVLKERDEAREELKFIKTAYGQAESNDLTRDALELKLGAVESERNVYRHIARELLAVLCGDGGHYAAEHGLDAAMKHGLERFYADKKALDRLRYFASNEADRDCEYGDNCPSNAGSRHYQCSRCKALEALDGYLG